MVTSSRTPPSTRSSMGTDKDGRVRSKMPLTIKSGVMAELRPWSEPWGTRHVGHAGEVEQASRDNTFSNFLKLAVKVAGLRRSRRNAPNSLTTSPLAHP